MATERLRQFGMIDYVNLEDGVTEQEAVIIAQKCLSSSSCASSFNKWKYKISAEVASRSFWKIDFQHKDKDSLDSFIALVNIGTGEDFCKCLLENPIEEMKKKEEPEDSSEKTFVPKQYHTPNLNEFYEFINTSEQETTQENED